MTTSNLLIATHVNKTIQAHLANGHIGLQGSDSGVAPARSFMQGISDLTPADFYRMANFPTWNAFEVEVGGETLTEAFARGGAQGYEQVVDMATGSLSTRYRVTIGGIDLDFEIFTVLSMADRFCRLSVRSLFLRRAVGPRSMCGSASPRTSRRSVSSGARSSIRIRTIRANMARALPCKARYRHLRCLQAICM